MSLEVTVRILKADDLEEIVEVEERITGVRRPEYYRHKIALAGFADAQINSSLVATIGGRVVGYLLGSLYLGEFGIPESSAVVDTIGVDPDYQDRGVGGALLDQFRSNMRIAGVERIYTLVDWKEFGLLKFFGHLGFVPSPKLSLECEL